MAVGLRWCNLVALCACAALTAVSVPSALAVTVTAPDISKTKGDVTVSRGENAGEVSLLDGDVIVRGRVLNDVSIANGDVRVERGGRVGGDINVANGNIVVARGAQVGGTAQIANGDISVARGGLIQGDARALSGDIDAPAETVRGDRDTGSDALPNIKTPNIDLNWGFPGWIVMTVLALIAGALVALIAPGFLAALADRLLTKPWLSPLVGLSSMIWVPLVIVILAITVIGLIILPFLLAALAIAWIAGWLGGAYLVGSLVLPGEQHGRNAALLATLVGVLLLRLVDLIPIAGFIANWCIALVGLGALTLLVFGQRGEPRGKALVPAP